MKRFDMREELDGNKYMEISIMYEKANSPLSINRGYYIYFSNVEIEDGFKKFVPMDDVNFKIFFKSAKRFSSKQMEKIVDFVLNHKDEFFKLYKNQDREAIFDLLEGIQ